MSLKIYVLHSTFFLYKNRSYRSHCQEYTGIFKSNSKHLFFLTLEENSVYWIGIFVNFLVIYVGKAYATLGITYSCG